jgi:hypothetical protein
MTLSPSSGASGSIIRVKGYNLPPGTRVQVLWNGRFEGYPTAWVNPTYGRTHADIRVPNGTPGGVHRVTFAQVLNPARTLVTSASQLGTWYITRSFTLTGSGAAPTPAPAPGATGMYGTAIAADSKANLPIGPWGRVSHRFRASQTSQLVSVRFSQRGGSGGYSGGTGGRIRVSVQPDSNGRPSGQVLASLTFSPGNSSGGWTTFNRYSFPSPATLTAGNRYHIVYHNIDPAPLRNWISVNDIFAYSAASVTRPPSLTSDYAVLDEEYGAWSVKGEYTAALDLTYANGRHDGQSYIEAMIAQYGSIAGSTNMVRETFVVGGSNRTISSATVRVRRSYGSSPLVVRLETGGGTVLGSASIGASAVRVSQPGDFGASVSEVWVTANFGKSITLAKGGRYNLRLSTGSGTEYTTIPLREGTDSGLASFRFTDGSGQRTTNGGRSWSNLYEWSPVDLQFFLK